VLIQIVAQVDRAALEDSGRGSEGLEEVVLLGGESRHVDTKDVGVFLQKWKQIDLLEAKR
jgi:hypothetical protein